MVNPRFFSWRLLVGAGAFVVGCGAVASGQTPARPQAAERFHREIEPLLTKYCYDCHGEGKRKGKVAFDEFTSDADLLSHPNLWSAALKNVRAGLMPPPDDTEADARPTTEEIKRLEHWIKFEAFAIDPAKPDPGRITLRRLNRVEYRNTIRDLMGIDFNSEVEFPPDDTGHGFDNLGEVLTVSPLLLEKYLQAAEEVVDKAVPRVGRVAAKRMATARDFRRETVPAVPNAKETPGNPGEGPPPAEREARTRDLNVRRGGKLVHAFSVTQSGTYKVALDANVRSTFDFDTGRANLVISVDGVERQRQEIVWGGKPVRFDSEQEWTAGAHQISVEMQPLPELAPNPVDPPPRAPDPADLAALPAVAGAGAPGAAPGGVPADFRRPPAERSVDLRIVSAEVQGPMDENHWVPPENYRRFFPEDVPASLAERDAFAQKVLRDFATRAFRRPVDEAKVTQLVAIARSIYTEPGRRFEDGIARAMMGVLASPRFLFRLEEPAPGEAAEPFAAVDEHALASRLSYFLWSSMPDEELFGLARRGELRKQLPAQVARMLKDPKSQAFVKNFPGQWLQARDIETVPINARAVLGIGNARGNRASRIDLDGTLRKMMRSETEMYFEHVLREDRSVLEFVDSDYTFLNGRLAIHYGIPGVTGENIRRVTLPANSPRGGMLTQGTVLAVTSNPTRTSPVKRGLFVLENILGTPPPPPPPDIPALEESQKTADGRDLPLREALAAHRANALCSSCHARMDPLGFALENFNAMGMWRELDAKLPIDPAGKLVTGEKFADIRELKRVLATERRADFYRCLTEKMLTYALGRGLEYYDVQTVDEIVARLERDQGRFSTLLTGVIESAPFQKHRNRNASPQLTQLSPP
ncbi:MAG TPA: DUF1592 domain-containing protein [Opitutaceae bacterium]|nr:DUF1592 domain-containing protein [Opitutaceae bacterium]